jgi:transcription-repair coupling factor (superfamily II helicase)
MFLEMLDEEVRRLRGEPPSERTDPELSIAVAARIPESYVADAKDRLRLYKAMSSAHNETSLAELVAEMRDRYGALPEELGNFVAILALKQMLARLQVARADVTATKLSLSWEERPGVVTPESLVSFVGMREDRARLVPPARLEMRLRGEGFRAGLAAAVEELSLLGRPAPAAMGGQ